jgi:hypothetical protein
MVVPQVKERVFVINGGKSDNDAEAVGNPILPEVPVTKLQEWMTILFGHIRWFFGFLAFIPLVIDPKVEQVISWPSDFFCRNWSIHQGTIAAPDGILVNERQMHHIQLILDGARIMVCKVIFQGCINHRIGDGFEPWNWRIFLVYCPPKVNKAMLFANREDCCVKCLGRY